MEEILYKLNEKYNNKKSDKTNSAAKNLTAIINKLEPVLKFEVIDDLDSTIGIYTAEVQQDSFIAGFKAAMRLMQYCDK